MDEALRQAILNRFDSLEKAVTPRCRGTHKALVESMEDRIRELFRKGFSMRQVYQELHDGGSSITYDTLRKIVRPWWLECREERGEA